MKKKKICVDAGHGGSDPGAVGGGIEEEDIALDVANRLDSFLKGEEVEVIRTRTDDRNWKNSRRVKVANEAKVDVFVAVHCNSAKGKARGFEVIHFPRSVNGKRLATLIAEALMANVKGIPPRKPMTKDYSQLGRGKNFYLTVIKDTLMPSVVVEIGFISSDKDRQEFDEGHERQAVAEAIGCGVLDYLGKGQDKTKPNKEDSGMNAEEKAYFEAVAEARTEKEEEIKGIGDELSAILEDKKVSPKEIPAVLRIVAKLVTSVTGMLGLFGVPASVVVIVTLVAETTGKLADGLDVQMEKLLAAGAIIKEVLSDKKVKASEIMPLMGAISNIVEAVISVALPFLTPEFTKDAEELGGRLRRVIEFLDKIPGLGDIMDIKKKPPRDGMISRR